MDWEEKGYNDGLRRMYSPPLSVYKFFYDAGYMLALDDKAGNAAYDLGADDYLAGIYDPPDRYGYSERCAYDAGWDDAQDDYY